MDAVEEDLSNTDPSAEDQKLSSDGDEYADVIDTSTVKRVIYPPAAGNLPCNPATQAGKHVDGDGLKV